jgi:ribosomal protein S27E
VSDDDNITKLPVTFRKPPEEGRVLFRPWEVGKRGGCDHSSFVVDEKSSTVECATCGEKLNPMWVLQYLASEDRRFKENQKRAQEVMASMNARVRTKCEHCGQMTRIRHR